MARHEPPTKNKRSFWSPIFACSSSMTASMWALRPFLPPLISRSLSGPKGDVSRLPTRPSRNSANSSEAPPISHTSPYDLGQPSNTPCAERRASSLPSMIQSFRPVCASTSSRKASPSEASRTAAVATVVSGGIPKPSASFTKRKIAASARVRPSGFRWPVSASPAPKPHMIFSL